MKATVLRVLIALPHEDFDQLLEPIKRAGGVINIETIYGIEPVKNMTEAIQVDTNKSDLQRSEARSEAFGEGWDVGYLEAVRDIAAFIEMPRARTTISVDRLGRDLRSGAFFGAQHLAHPEVDTSFTLDIEAMCDGEVPDSVLDEDESGI